MSTSSVELLAPAGDLECLRAAVENGADAVYFGLDRGFNARVRAENLNLENLAETMSWLHQRSVRGYVTLNTLIFPQELAEFEDLVRGVALAGVDAVLVQDLGAARLVRQISPTLPLHASTQMTLTSAECIQAVRSLDLARVVLPRELSLDEIRAITQHTDMPLEVFVHGALCVAYSGQCLTSESLGGRSANRGQCAQACRLPYEVYCDGKHVDLARQKYLLSPQDLAAYELIPELVALGVTSLKIEGRLKSPEYVACVTAHYRQALDHAQAGRQVRFARAAREEMELTFSRGLAPGWLEGCDHKRLVPGLSSAKRGLQIGHVIGVRPHAIRVALTGRVRPGDGVMFDDGQPQNEQPGGRVYAIRVRGERVDEAGPSSADAPNTNDPSANSVTAPTVSGGPSTVWHSHVAELSFSQETFPWDRIAIGQSLWKTDDPALSRHWRRTFTQADPQIRRPLDFHLTAHVDAVLKLRASFTHNPGESVTCEATSATPLAVAKKHPASDAWCREQLDRLGHTPFVLGQVTTDIQGGPMIPLSVLGEVRRGCVDGLLDQLAVHSHVVAPNSALESLRSSPFRTNARRSAATPLELTERSESTLSASRPEDLNDDQTPQLHLLCRTWDQFETLLALDIDSLTVDFADIRQYGAAAERAREAGVPLRLATPRIHKPGETGIFRALARHPVAGILARNLAALAFFRELSVCTWADYSLNVANELTANWLQHELAPERITPSYDLNRDQLVDLVGSLPSASWEVVIHQHMPMFHMEHCVFCAILSPGTNKTNCGRPCDEHQVVLEDRVGQRHPLTADIGCRNTLYNATPQSAAEVVPELRSLGVGHFRVELIEATPTREVGRIVRLYRQLLEGQIPGPDVWAQLQAMNRVGVTRGTLETRRDPLAIL